VLAHPDFEKLFELECDVSKIQIGMILSQKDDQGNSRPIHFARMLTLEQDRAKLFYN